MRKYKKIAHVIDAIQLTQKNRGEACKILGIENTFQCGLDLLYMQTKEGILKARFGDYIIRGIEGEFYTCAESIFLKSYVPIECAECGNTLQKAFKPVDKGFNWETSDAKEYIYCEKCGKEFSKEGEENE